MTLQDKLRAIREREGFKTQDDLAKASGVSLKSIADYERGAARPTLGKLVHLADALGCGLDELVGRTTPPPRVFVNDVPYVPANGGAAVAQDVSQAIADSGEAISARPVGRAAREQQRRPRDS